MSSVGESVVFLLHCQGYSNKTRRVVISPEKWRGRERKVVETRSVLNKETEMGQDTNKSGEQKHTSTRGDQNTQNTTQSQ